MLVGVTHYGIRVRRLGNEAQRTTRIPVLYLAHSAGLMIRCGHKMQETVHAIRIGGIRDDRTSVRRSGFADQEIGTSRNGGQTKDNNREQHSCYDKGFSHNKRGFRSSLKRLSLFLSAMSYASR